MTENPYESPQSYESLPERAMPQPFGALAFIAVPVAGTISFGICYALFQFLLAINQLNALMAILILAYVSILITLIGFKQFVGGGYARGERIKFFLTAVGAMLSAPVAFIVAGYFVLGAIFPDQDRMDPGDIIKAWFGVWLGCCIWATGMWVGMNFPSKNF